MGSMLDSSIKFVQGVGEVRAKLLEKELGIVTMRDMLYHFPFRYIDRSRTYEVREVAEDNASAYIQLRVKVVGKAFAGEGRKQRFSVYAADDTGRVELIWFRGIKWIERLSSLTANMLSLVVHPSSVESFRWCTPKSRLSRRLSRVRLRVACRVSIRLRRNSRLRSAQRVCIISSARCGALCVAISGSIFPNISPANMA